MKSIASFYNEREKTRRFYQMLEKHRAEALEHPERFIPLGKIKNSKRRFTLERYAWKNIGPKPFKREGKDRV